MNIAPEMHEKLTAQVRDNDVVLYMKGTANFPMCGFSQRAARVLQSAGVKFKDFNILEDDDLRVALKVFSDWPTFPQCYIKGEFIGGSDILLELYENGELENKLDGVPKT